MSYRGRPATGVSMHDVGLGFPGLGQLLLATKSGTATIYPVLLDISGKDIVCSAANPGLGRLTSFEVTTVPARFLDGFEGAVGEIMNPDAVGIRVYVTGADVYWNWGGNPDSATVPNTMDPDTTGIDGVLIAGGTYIIGRGAPSAVQVTTPSGSSGSSTLALTGVDLERICLIADAARVVSVEFFDFSGNTVFQGTITAGTTAKSLRNLYEAVGSYDAWTSQYASVIVRGVAGTVYYNFAGNGTGETGAPYGVTAAYAPTVGGTFSTQLTTGTQLGTYFGA